LDQKSNVFLHGGIRSRGSEGVSHSEVFYH
jgi:hypothetical protein